MLRSDVIRGNAILAGIDGDTLEQVQRAGELVTLAVRDDVYRSRERIEYIYFPVTCVLSIITQMKDGSEIEVGTIGREGVSAIPLLLGAQTTKNDAYCQVPGTAVRMTSKSFMPLTENRRFRQLLDRFVQGYVNMLGQLVACNRLHSVDERCARWLLMTQDRVGGPTIELTQEFLAMMLGARRSGVTIAVGILTKAGFISHERGVIEIVDRAGLKAASCECYAVAEDEFNGLLRRMDAFGTPGRSD